MRCHMVARKSRANGISSHYQYPRGITSAAPFSLFFHCTGHRVHLFADCCWPRCKATYRLRNTHALALICYRAISWPRPRSQPSSFCFSRLSVAVPRSMRLRSTVKSCSRSLIGAHLAIAAAALAACSLRIASSRYWKVALSAVVASCWGLSRDATAPAHAALVISRSTFVASHSACLSIEKTVRPVAARMQRQHVHGLLLLVVVGARNQRAVANGERDVLFASGHGCGIDRLAPTVGVLYR